jgi:hypothetical protein
MPHPFDPGYGLEPYLSLCAAYPGPDVYPPGQFRIEWGPIFHRGRLDGSARVLIIGQDPAQHETVVRRILVGEAGRRVQGFLAKLGITRSYVFINAFLYSVYGSVRAATRRDPRLMDYRNAWLGALAANNPLEAALTLGTAAAEAWDMWRATPAGQAMAIPVAHLIHPTQPESSSKNDRAKLAAATKRMLAQWNDELAALAPAIRHPDQAVPLVLYGDVFKDGERPAIPADDMPAGLPDWMHEQDGWARRAGAEPVAKRRNVTITVPKEVIA